MASHLNKRFGENEHGRGHWDEILAIRDLCICDSNSNIMLLRERPKLAISRIRCDSCSNDLRTFPTCILQYSVDNKNCCSIMKLFSCSDDGIFSNNKPCVLLLKDAHFYNVWGYDSFVQRH